MTRFQSNDVADLPEIAKKIISQLTSSVICFYGDLGSGKTTLIKEILKLLGVEESISSPTFSLVNQYQSKAGIVFYHFDFYRIVSENEAFDIGFEEYLDSTNLCFIEWPERIESFLPLDFHKISIESSSSTRNITFE